MITMFVRHHTADYAAWRKVYDGFEGTRRKMGVRGAAVYQDVSDPNEVTAWHSFDDLAAASAFAGSSELREAMKAAGVVGAPTIWFTTGTKS